MKPQLPELLAALTGEELYHLSVKMSGAVTASAALTVLNARDGQEHRGRAAMVEDLADVRNDVLMQVCRITVAIGRAEKIVSGSMFGRGHIVRVPGT